MGPLVRALPRRRKHVDALAGVNTALTVLRLAWLLTGCEGGRREPQPSAPSNHPDSVPRSAPSPSPSPTWSRDVAPLMARHCGACHGGDRDPDGHRILAPPALGTYDDAVRSAGPALLAVRRRMMPPFGADNTGLCGSWVDDTRLSDAEIAMMGTWVDHGMQRGDTRPAPTLPPTSSTLDVMGSHRTSVDPGVPFVPGLGDRAYRCFLVVPEPHPAGAITGLTVSSEPVGAVRQASLYQLDDHRAARRARDLDAADRGPGWACFGAPDIAGATLLASWSRNTPVQTLPADTGLPWAGEPAVVLQVRYDLIASAPGLPARARMTLTTGAVARTARLLTIRSAPFALAPGQTQARVRANWVADENVTLLGLVPRMNTLGRVLDLTRSRAGQRQCLAHFGHWSLYDQQLFRSSAPVGLAAGDVVTLTCEFNTTSRPGTTLIGESPDQEQCVAHLYLIEAR